jgi:hypothetical protein
MIYFFMYENEERALRFVQEVLLVFRGQSSEQGRSLEGQKVGAEEPVGPPGHPDVGERRRVGEGDEALAGELLPGHDALDHVLPVQEALLRGEGLFAFEARQRVQVVVEVDT